MQSEQCVWDKLPVVPPAQQPDDVLIFTPEPQVKVQYMYVALILKETWWPKGWHAILCLKKCSLESPGRVNVLCSWANHFTLTVPLFTQEYKWVPVNCQEPDHMLGREGMLGMDCHPI